MKISMVQVAEKGGENDQYGCDVEKIHFLPHRTRIL
jgi:hypothetical protein